jgi:hypothetical protein
VGRYITGENAGFLIDVNLSPRDDRASDRWFGEGLASEIRKRNGGSNGIQGKGYDMGQRGIGDQ